jgi:F0F1-type ATP synthase assembly protein I
MKKTKKILKNIDITEYKNFEKYLEKKARNGWMLIKMNKGTMVFESIEGREIKFNVSLLDQYAPFDYHDGEMERDYRTLCEEAGWIYCSSNLYFQVFYTDSNAETIPIHTDPAEEYRIIKKAIVKSNIINLILPCMYLAIGIMNFNRFNYEDLLSNSALFSLTWPFAITITWIAMFMHPAIWLIKNKMNVDRGRNLKFFSERQILIKNCILFSLWGLYMLLTISMFVDIANRSIFALIVIFPIVIPAVIAVLCINRFKKKRRSRKKNITFFIGAILIAMIVSMGSTTLILATGLLRSSYHESLDKPPMEVSLLELSDFGVTVEVERSRSNEESSFFSPLNVMYYETLGSKSKGALVSSVRTHYIELNNTSIADFVFEKFMDEEFERRDEEIALILEFDTKEKADEERNRITEIDPDLWHVDRGYYLYESKSKIIVQKGNIIYIISCHVDLSDPEIVKICRNKLGL